jgi:hypothetical protein
MKSEEFGKSKLSEVPRVNRAMIITKDRVLILNYENQEAAITASKEEKEDDDDDDTSKQPDVAGDSASLFKAAESSSENSSENKSPSVENAQQLVGLKAIVKSNHHLTEIVKMTKLKKEPDILTLHYRDGAAYDTATLEGVRRRAYKMHGGKDEFIECLQLALERFN